MSADNLKNRRFLKTRQKAWAQGLARTLSNSGLTPNMISVLSIVFAAFGAYAFLQLANPYSGWWWGLLAVLGIQLRLAANMMDGLVAVEGGKKTATGDLYNEVPDRVADVLIILGAGYACSQSYSLEIAWGLALLSVCTAYIRCLGASLLGEHDFIGPQAKQHRMFLLSVAGLGTSVERLFTNNVSNQIIYVILIISLMGTAITCARRLMRISAKLKNKFGTKHS